MTHNDIIIGLLDCGHNSDAWRNCIEFLHDFDNWISVAEETRIPFVAWRLLNHTPFGMLPQTHAGWYYYAPQAGYPESRPNWHWPVGVTGLSRRTAPEYDRPMYLSPHVAARLSDALMRLKIIVYKSGSVTKDGRFHFGGTHWPHAGPQQPGPTSRRGTRTAGRSSAVARSLRACKRSMMRYRLVVQDAALSEQKRRLESG